MKKFLLPVIAGLMTLTATAQTVQHDTVAVGAGYANQVWYSLANGIEGSAPKTNWDLAFNVVGSSSSIHINTITGTTLWIYPKGDTADWAGLDTAGLATWVKLDNSDTSWFVGAFDATLDPENDFDLGWGVYNMINHSVVGDSIYVIKLANNTYQKLWIERLASGAYNFRHANLDGTNEMQQVIVKNDYKGKNFAYYSLQNHVTLDREPASADWDLVFTQYATILPGYGAYSVTGILSNRTVKIAKVKGVDADSYNDFGPHTFSTEINTIGYNWKTFTGSDYAITDSLVHFVKDVKGDVWKVVCTGFGGSSKGEFMFSKEKIASVGIAKTAANTIPVVLYPNPAQGENITLIYDLKEGVQSASMDVFNMAGQKVYSQLLNTAAGLNQEQVSLASFTAGVYMIRIQADGQQSTQKLIVR